MSFLSGLGQAVGGLAGLFGSHKDPAKEANKYLSQIPGAMSKYYQPYMQAGSQALGNVQGQYGQLTSDPGAMYNQFASGYQASPGYQYKLQQALGAGSNAAAAGGMLGTPEHQEKNMNIAQGITSQDFEEYMKHIMGLYGKGLEGQQGLETQGYQANTGYGENLGNVLGKQGEYAYYGQAGKNSGQASALQNLFSGAGNMFGGF